MFQFKYQNMSNQSIHFSSNDSWSIYVLTRPRVLELFQDMVGTSCFLHSCEKVDKQIKEHFKTILFYIGGAEGVFLDPCPIFMKSW